MKKVLGLILVCLVVISTKTWSGCPDGMKPIPSGKFKMGFRGEEARTKSFCMDVYEVTVAQYKSFKPGYVSHELSEPDDHPVTFITQNEAQAYCQSLGKLTFISY